MSQGQDLDIDVSADICTMIIEEGSQAHQALMVESRGMATTVHGATRLVSMRKYNEVDPIEAASVEMILSGSPNPQISRSSPRSS